MRALLRLPLFFYRLGLGGLASNLPVMPVMTLTTRGHKSKQPRFTALEYRRHGSKFYAISAWGQRAHWLKNIQVDPTVTIQQGRKAYCARASLVDDEAEAMRVLALFRRKAPLIYDPLLARLSSEETVNARVLPEISDRFVIVRFDTDVSPLVLPTLPADLVWVWGVLGMLGAITAFLGYIRLRRHFEK